MIWTEIRCDVCGAIGTSRAKTHAHILRGELRKNGWISFEAGGKDYCPKCRNNRNQKPVSDVQDSTPK